jgi:hypothetical protein
MATKKKTYRCDRCGRRLTKGLWIWSRYTRQRYCWPGKGCNR